MKSSYFEDTPTGVVFHHDESDLKLAYIAGKFSNPELNTVKYNVLNAALTAVQAKKRGYFPICPHTNSYKIWELEGFPDDHEYWLEGDLVLLSKCDLVILVPNWRESKGATAEVAFAQAHNIPVYEIVDGELRELTERN